MLEKGLKHSSRKELLELLLEVTKENEQLKEEIDILESQVKKQTIIITEKNSIAEVSIKIAGVFEVMEQVTAKYLENNERLLKKEELVG